ncbi:FAD-binding and (Fe-S)-binding domain-containing protein [Corynebacterium sp. MSK008]|uniref:FAD-binding and (Fe-S)-binding domain-containing protein n=1 Tax=Corynebacterium sp. MSK008 TaxID=3050188 RepID=UPI00254FD152|nr:FAD-binding and (Fe-S)-binding domain-containing protein [Corynebacterium sp. MSK008]MDK8878726.1 FAD-binding and (Fe-S)-binding domain-containing protein [Corynebacterium sp. MSK008]
MSQATSPIAFKLRKDMPTRAAYSSDASLFRRVPAAVLEPETKEDIVEGLKYARERGWPVVGRGGGSSVAGNAIGDGLIIDTSRHFNRILSIDPVAKTATVQPGVICDDLRAAAAEFGLTYGPDPSTHSRCTIGGMVANNACGSHSVAYGTSASNLLEVELLLADGRLVTFTSHSCSDPDLEAALKLLYADNHDLIHGELGRFPRQVSGYGLHFLGTDMAKTIAGSEGTLGIITEMKVQLVDLPKAKALTVLSFQDVFAAAAAAPKLRQPGVATIEGMGGDLLDALRSKNGMSNAGENLPGQPNAGGWLYCETTGATREEALAVGEALTQSVDHTGAVVVSDPVEARALWRIREASAGIVTRLPDGGEAWPNWEDSAVPPENLADYLRGLYALMDRYGYRGIPFGHFGEGCVHVRISFDFTTTEGITKFHNFMNDAAELVNSHGGSLSGEHGDGRARSALLGKMYSPEMRALFEKFKLTFDPQRVFNPGVLVFADAVTDGLRMHPAQRTHEITPVQLFPKDRGSFTNAVNRCVGVSACRSMDGAMCPSFQITKDEVHSTRGRARILSELFRGETVEGDDVEDALDLCLSCKACASDCPVNVDMATYKSEFLNNHYQGKVRPRVHYLMGWLPLLSHIAHKLPGVPRLVNFAMHAPGISKVVARVGGVDTGRPLISFAPQSLQKWFAKRPSHDGAFNVAGSSTAGSAGKVVLWPDSFNNKLEISPAIAAVEVLEFLGFEVIVPQEFVCCGLTWHSTGQLDMTRRVLRHSAQVLKPYLDQGLPVVAIEPSCLVMLHHEATSQTEDPEVAHLASATRSFAETISPRISELVAEGAIDPASGSVLTQVHCHERSLGDPQQSSLVLEALGYSEEQIETGCCGLAGNWGFEDGHAEMSLALGERELFPRVREHVGPVLADGFSCRTQVSQGTDTRASHLAEIVRDALLR